MKKSKEAGIVVLCSALGCIACYIMADFYPCDLWLLFAMLSVVLPSFICGVIEYYRYEKPMYDRAKRINALKETNQDQQ